MVVTSSNPWDAQQQSKRPGSSNVKEHQYSATPDGDHEPLRDLNVKESKAEEQRGLQAARTQSWLADPSDRLQWELSHGGYLSRGKSPRLGPVPERQENPQKYKESPRAVASLDKTKLNSEGAKHNLHQINDTQTNEDHGLTASRPDKPPSKVSQANAEAATSTSTGANYVDTRAQRTLFIKGITDIIMHGAVIKYIITTAVHDPTVEEEKLCRDVQGCISSFGTELEVEAGNPSQHSIARAMQKKTLLIYATGLFRSQLAAAQAVSLKASRVAVLPEQDRKYDDSNITSDVDSLSDDGSEVAERLDCERETMEKHLLGSEAYGLFLQRLLDIAHETYRYRIEIALDRSAIDETGLKYGDTSLHELTRQLAWVPPQTLRFVEDSYSDWIKVFMEQVLGEQCEWWPLEPPSRLLRTGYCLLYWQSIPQERKRVLESSFATAPPLITCSSYSTSVSSGTVGSSTGAADNDLELEATANIGMSKRGKNRRRKFFDTGEASRDRLPPAIVNGYLQRTRTSKPKPEPGYLYLKVNNNSNIPTSIGITSIDDDHQFFAELNTEYCRARGWLRCWFSMWRFNRCEFYRFKRFGVRSCHPKQVGFPAKDNDLYDFKPRPIIDEPPHGPITSSEFHDRYYNTSHAYFNWRDKQCSKLFIPNEKRCLSSLPKRIRLLEPSGHKDFYEDFYGLYAKERFAFVWFLAYVFACLLPGFVFFFLWVFQWNHTELGNGAIPITLTITTFTCLMTYVWNSHDD